MGSGRRVLGNDPFQRGAAERTPPAASRPPAPEGAAAAGGPGTPSSTAGAPPTGHTGRKTPSRHGGKRPATKPTPASARTRPLASGTSMPSAAPGTPLTARDDAASAVPPPRVPLAASVVPEPPVDRRESASFVPAPERLEEPTESLRGPLALSDRPAAESPPGASPEPTLRWAPLPDATPAAVAELERPAETATAAAGGSLVEALRDAPGLLAEAWSAIEAAVRAVRAGLGTAGGEQLDIYGRDARLSEAVAPLVDFLYSRWFRVEVEGAAHIPPGGALLVANHAGALPLDGPMLHEALRRERPDLPEARWLAEDQVFYAPLLGTLFNRLGAVRASPDSAVRLLGDGRPVLVFPEGIQGIGKPFRERYRLQRFGRGGFVKLALRTGRPILPVAIMGAEETLPLLGKLPGGLLGVPYVPVTPLPLPLPAKWRIRVGEPVAVPPGAKETDLSVVESLVDATRNTIEQMLRELLGARGGVFLG